MKNKLNKVYGKIPMNEYWTRPLKEDTVKNYNKIEGGCYW